MNARDRILDGAAEVMRSRGLANTTTKEIAKASGLSEAMLYKVFRDKVDLFLGVLSERLPRIAMLGDGAAEKIEDPGATMSARLRHLVAEVLAFYLESFPIAASIFSDPDLLTRYREVLWERGAGPHTLVQGVAAYLATEQRAGQMAKGARPDVIAELLVGACLHRAFLTSFAGETISAAKVRRFADEVVGAFEPSLTVS